jgi:DNA-binding NtrC family response regulator
MAEMVAVQRQFDQINVLASAADWAWPLAQRQLFHPRGINLLMANGTDEVANILRNRRIQAAIIDTDSERTGFAMIKVIRMEHPLVPFIALSSKTGWDLLDKALQLDVFGVIDKPVDMEVLRELLNRLFIKRYNCNIFSSVSD